MDQVRVDSALMKTWTPLDEPTLVSQLNGLLTSLCIPIPLISPTDLTPRLLIAILESILGIRIPVIERQDDSQLSKVQNMKIFLGVLETDILQLDVGLSQLDLRRLVCGEREEVTFIAELLCWIGRRMKLINTKKIKDPVDVFLSPSQARRPHSSTSISMPTSQRSRMDPSPSSSKQSLQLEINAPSTFHTNSTYPSTLPNDSPFANRPFEDESFTSIDTDDHPLLRPPFNPKPPPAKQTDTKDDDSLSSISDILGGLLNTLNLDQREHPRCIHEIPSPSSVRSSPRKSFPSTPPRESSSNLSRNRYPEPSKESSICDSFDLSKRSPPVRYGGYIEPVDENSEIASFELSRSISIASEESFDDLVQDEPVPTLNSVREQYTRTLELLNERARLLTHLAELKNSTRKEAVFS